MNEEMQKKFMEFQEAGQLMQQLEKQSSTIQTQLAELTLAKQNLDYLGTVEAGTEILVPISNGVYAKASLKDNKNFVVNVGSEVTVPRTSESAKEMIDSQIEEMKKMQDTISQEIQENSVKAALLEQQLRELASKGKDV